MNKKIRALLVSMLCASAAVANGPSNKTFLMPRDQIMNMAWDFTTWHRVVNAEYKNKGKGHIGARVQATTFYQATERRKALAKYFGPEEKEIEPGREDAFIVDAEAAVGSNALLPQDILHNEGVNPTTDPLKDTIQFRPEQELWGVKLSYVQVLDKLLHGLYFKVGTPIVYINSTMGAKSIGDDVTQQITESTSVNRTTGVKSNNPRNVRVFDYLDGNVMQSASLADTANNTFIPNPNKQDMLTKLRVPLKGPDDDDDDEADRDSIAGLADVRIDVGYNFYDRKHAHAGVSMAVVIPTGSTPDSKKLFEAIIGNGGHVEWGGSLDGHYEWTWNDDFTFGIHAAVNYMYVWESTEKRTLGFNDSVTGELVDRGHYLVGGRDGRKGVSPLANPIKGDFGGVGWCLCNWNEYFRF